MLIDSPQNPLIKRLRSLHSQKGRQEEGAYLAEGPSVVAEALMYAPGIEAVLWCEALADGEADEIADAAEQAGIRVHELSQRAFETISDTQTPQGVAAVLGIMPASLADVDVADGGCVLVLHDLRDPGNLGTMIRSADAFGARGVILSGECADPYAPKVVRASAGSMFHLPIVEADWAQVVPWAREAGVKLYAADGAGTHIAGKVGIPKRVALVIGNEGHGLPQSVLHDADYAVRIPMSGRAESLNAAVAASVLLFEAQRQLSAGS